MVRSRVPTVNVFLVVLSHSYLPRLYVVKDLPRIFVYAWDDCFIGAISFCDCWNAASNQNTMAGNSLIGSSCLESNSYAL